ncbi:hypothetical protein AB4Y30_10320 [Ornithinibacillus sp. 4-3]|uniref:Uncharacterized protein n=1 Tax=Ornithinibacillus sp. 4-3 TaxID=3231488 RepID=A0AB39HLI1_9BACI
MKIEFDKGPYFNRSLQYCYQYLLTLYQKDMCEEELEHDCDLCESVDGRAIEGIQHRGAD